jgi:asparagine synthase (glutamine-hydrolysing)
MCGLSSIVSLKNIEVPEALIRLVNNRIRHRGPNGEGYYYGDNFAFGHRRLSVIDLSHRADQPFVKDEDCIIYNGMIYNYGELRSELISLGHTFISKCDTEVILAAYQQWGTGAFSRFNGMWAFIIYDAAKSKLILCRDRYGIKPLYISTVGDHFIAVSEIKQLIDFPQFKPVLNREVANQFLATGITNYSAETFFKGVNELRPGHYLEYDLITHQQKITRWYDLKKEIKYQQIPEEKAVQLVRDLLTDSITIRSKADVVVGSCLSGGLDSSSIVAIIHNEELEGPGFKTITSCYEDKECDEREYSDIITSQTGFPSVKVFPDLDDLLDKGDWDKMIYHFDQPFSSASHYSEYSVFKTARENNLTVMLDGQGADEYICGYSDYFYTYIRQLISKGQFGKAWSNLKNKFSRNEKNIFQGCLNFFKAAYYYPFHKKIRRFSGKSECPWLINQEKPGVKNKNALFEGEGIEEMSLHQMLYSSLGYQLHSQDRNSMLFSIESRVPFLDHRLVENIMGMPSDYKIKNGYSKYILLQAVNELPLEIRYRKTKMCFPAPGAVWMIRNKIRIREELKSAMDYTGMFSDVLLQMFDKFTEGKTYFDSNIFFRVISFYKFCKIFKLTFKGSTYTIVPNEHDLMDIGVR